MTATIETNLRQGDLETEVHGMKETETESNEASSEWEEEHQKSRADELGSRSLLRSSPQSMKMFCGGATAWTDVHREGAVAAKAQATAQVDVPTAPRQCCGFFLVNSSVSSLPIVEAQKSQRNASGVDRRETGLFLEKDVTVWGLGLFDPTRCAHLPGTELKTD